MVETRETHTRLGCAWMKTKLAFQNCLKLKYLLHPFDRKIASIQACNGRVQAATVLYVLTNIIAHLVQLVHNLMNLTVCVLYCSFVLLVAIYILTVLQQGICCLTQTSTDIKLSLTILSIYTINLYPSIPLYLLAFILSDSTC